MLTYIFTVSILYSVIIRVRIVHLAPPKPTPFSSANSANLLRSPLAAHIFVAHLTLTEAPFRVLYCGNESPASVVSAALAERALVRVSSRPAHGSAFARHARARLHGGLYRRAVQLTIRFLL